MVDESVPKIDIAEHQNTYATFINFSMIAVVVIFNTLVCLILFGYGGSTGTVFGTIFLLASFVAGAIGMASGKRGWIPPAIVFLCSVAVWVVTIS